MLSSSSTSSIALCIFFFFFQAEDGIRDHCVTGVQTCALPIYRRESAIEYTLAALDHRVLGNIPQRRKGGSPLRSELDGILQRAYHRVVGARLGRKCPHVECVERMMIGEGMLGDMRAEIPQLREKRIRIPDCGDGEHTSPDQGLRRQRLLRQ